MKQVIELTVNGIPREILIRPGMTLLEVLRDELKLHGVRESCGMGVCGCCTVIMNGRLATACLTLALQSQGAEILTVEGLARGDQLHPIQEAFVEEGAIQCGFCTPGFVLATKALLEENPHPTVAEIKSYLSGNLCRCTGYVKIIKAVQAAAKKLAAAG